MIKLITFSFKHFPWLLAWRIIAPHHGQFLLNTFSWFSLLPQLFKFRMPQASFFGCLFFFICIHYFKILSLFLAFNIIYTLMLSTFSSAKKNFSMNCRLPHCNDHKRTLLISGKRSDLQNCLSPQLGSAFTKGYMTATKVCHGERLFWELLKSD